MRKNSNKRLIAIAIVLLLAISIGYAALSTTLTINGTANIAANSWLIYFTNVQVKTGSSTATQAPTTSGTSTTTLTWAVNLQTPGDYYEYNVDVKNDGTIDAMIGSLSNTSLNTNQAKYLNYTVTYSDGAVIEQYDKLDSNETVTLKVRVEYKTDLNPEDLPTENTPVTLTYTSNYVQADENAKNRNTIASLNIGDTVNYTTTMNGVTLNNWKVFYIDGDYTTLILADYLPNAAIDTTSSAFSNLSKYSTYVIYANDNRIQLLDAMSTKSNWTSLLTGTINGTPINYAGTTDTNIWAMGSPTLDLYVNSWNTKYPADTIYTATTTSAMSDGLNGYYVGLTENPGTYYLDYHVMQAKEGYNNTLYYPHQEVFDNCYGYWLASPSAGGVNSAIYVDYDGYVSGNDYDSNHVAFRPIISLPSSILQ